MNKQPMKTKPATKSELVAAGLHHLTDKELARIVRLTTRTVRSMARRGIIPYYQPNPRTFLFILPEVLKATESKPSK